MEFLACLLSVFYFLILYINKFAFASQTKIVGGTASNQPVPYQVSLQRYLQSTGDYQHFCGGSIVSESHILTAAHCLDGVPKENITVVAGTLVWNKPGARYNVSSYEIHHDYKMLERDDIAMITLNDKIEFSDKINKIDITDEWIGPDRSCILTGWGYVSPLRAPSGTPVWLLNTLRLIPTELQIVELRTISNDDCRKTYTSNTLNGELCTMRWSKGACAGDSGGPLVSMDQKTQYGVVSFGNMYCGGFMMTPDVFTRVSNYTEWIHERIN